MRDQLAPGNARKGCVFSASLTASELPLDERSPPTETPCTAFKTVVPAPETYLGPKRATAERPRKATRRSGMDRIHRMSRGRKTLLSLLLVGALGAVAGIGTFSAFSATTVERRQHFNAGTVVDLTTTTSDAAMYNVTDAKPGDVGRAVHPGDLHRIARLDRAAVRARPVGAIGQYVNLTIDKGTGTVRSPTARASPLQANRLQRHARRASPPRTRTSPTVSSPTRASQTVWNQNDTLVYRFTLTLQNNPAASGLHVGHAQLHVGGAERLTPADPGGPRERPARASSGGSGPTPSWTGVSRPRRSHPAPSEPWEG